MGVGVWVCGCVGVWACGRVGVWACGRVGVWACGRVGVWACGRVGVWACGRVGVWACGRVGVWACGRVGVWACGRVGVWVCVCVRAVLSVSVNLRARSCGEQSKESRNWRSGLRSVALRIAEVFERLAHGKMMPLLLLSVHLLKLTVCNVQCRDRPRTIAALNADVSAPPLQRFSWRLTIAVQCLPGLLPGLLFVARLHESSKCAATCPVHCSFDWDSFEKR